ncbi:platelet binding protein GspB-like [Procambarus clarkii]|uniref:platelet binding protein GspB-like n=1 Tax=Procambarus clarkii TaxID=6728 RepID=UPI003743FA88
MWTWTSLVVLALAVASTLSFPRSDADYAIPNVGLGARAQYYVLHSDGTYKYGYDTGDGIYEQSMSQAPGNVNGAFGYKDATGEDIKLEYTADDRGFIAKGSHLPVAPKADFDTPTSGAASFRRISPAYPAQPAQPSTSAAAAAAPGSGVASVRSSPAVPFEVAQIRSSVADDGSYSFSYDTSSSSRSESADAQNSVKGRYSFIADDGINRQIDYIAGAETGYIAEGDSLPVGPPVPGAESGIPTGRILPVLSEEEANALAASTSAGSPPAVAYSAPSSPASPSSQIASQKVSSGASASDASYSFSYDAGDSSRSESADPSLNVQGTYSFVPADSNQRLTVNYRAGADTGFVAEGAHFPVAPVADVGSPVSGASAASSRGVSPAYSAPPSTSAAAPSSGVASVRSSPAVPFEAAQVRSFAADDGSYSFSYDTSSSSRSESADAQNSVKGRYSFIADDGINRQIDYIAGAETGYIAEGDSLPVGPPVPGAESGIPTGRILPVLSEEEANALAASTSAGSPPAVAYSAPSSPASPSSQIASQKVSSEASASDASDASYSFSYDAGDSSRSESADPSLNVQGTYSFIPADSNQRLTVNYRAGADTGFVAEGAHFPVAPVADVGSPVSGASAASSRGVSPAYSAPPSSSAAAPGYGVASVRSSPAVPFEVAQIRSSVADDGSYSFSYDTSSSSRSESADAQNSVKGRYSFIADDGINRQIDYIAGAETGYIAEGDSLPVGPPVPGAESGIPTGRILPVLSEEEANALAYSTSESKTAVGTKTAATLGTKSVTPIAATKSAGGIPSGQPSGSPSGHSTQVVGDVLLHQYAATNADKYGYVFTAIRR